MHSEALDTGQDPATRVRAGRPPHPSRPNEVRDLHSAIEDFRRSRFSTTVSTAGGQALTRAELGLRAVYLRSLELPQSGTADQPTRAATYEAGQRIVGHLRTILEKDAMLTGRLENYVQYFNENEKSLKARYPTLKQVRSDGSEKTLGPSLRERTSIGSSQAAVAVRNTLTFETGKKVANWGVNVSGVVGGMGAYFIAEHLALCWKNDDPDCFAVFRSFTSSGKGFYFLTSYVAMMEASRRLVGWSLGSRFKIFGEGQLATFWMSFGLSTFASQVFQAWFAADYVPVFERQKKEHAFIVGEIDKVRAELYALEHKQAGTGGTKDTRSPDALKKYITGLELRKAELKRALDERVSLFWNDLEKRAYNWEKIATEFVKTGLILSWIQQAKVGGELSMEAFRFRSDIKKGLVDFANAEKENMVQLLKDQSQKTMEVERAGFRHLWHELGKTRAFGYAKNGLVLVNAMGVNAARAYGLVPSATRTALGAGFTYLMPKRWMGPLQGIFSAFYDKFLRFFLDAASFAFVNSMMNSTVDYLGYKYDQTTLFPKLRYNLLGLEASLSRFAPSSSKIYQMEGESAYVSALKSFDAWFGHFVEVAKIWQSHRDVVIHKPIEAGLDAWAASIKGRSMERYREREWVHFFHRTADLDRLEAYQKDQKFLANGADTGRNEWHLDPTQWPGELAEEHRKYWKVYKEDIQGKPVNVDDYLKAKEREAALKLESEQQTKISEVGSKIDEVYLTGSARSVFNGASWIVDLVRTVSHLQVPACEIPQAPGNLNSSYIEEVKYIRLMVISWVQKYPSAMNSREVRDLHGGLKPSPCDFGPFRSRLRVSLENVADLPLTAISTLLYMPSMVFQEKIRWSLVARVVGKHLLDILGHHEVNRLKRDRLMDVTWNYVKKAGHLEQIQGNVGKALIAHEANRRVLIGSLRENGFVFQEDKTQFPFESEESRQLFRQGMDTLFRTMNEASVEALRKASNQQIIDASVDEGNLKICMDKGVSEADCRKALAGVGQ